MKQPQLKQHKLDLVLLGDFNPHIFQPQWFVLHKLLGEKEGDSAKVEIIHADISIFHLDWLRFEVTRNRLVATTSFDTHYEILKDLIIGTFTILSHTPLRAMGINNSFVHLIDSEKAWHNIGHTLAPKDIWSKVLAEPGMRNLIIESKATVDARYKRYTQVHVRPTNIKLELDLFINDHHELLVGKEDMYGSSEIIGILKDGWEGSQEKANKIKGEFFKELP